MDFTKMASNSLNASRVHQALFAKPEFAKNVTKVITVRVVAKSRTQELRLKLSTTRLVAYVLLKTTAVWGLVTPDLAMPAVSKS
jgi:hypothetical protein